MKTLRTLFVITTMITLQTNGMTFSNNLFNKDPFKKRKNNSTKVVPIEKVNIFPFKHTFKVSCGYSNVINRTNYILNNYQDTSVVKVGMNNFTPVFSLSHEIYLDNIFSISYAAGYSRDVISLDSKELQTTQASLFVRPKLSYFRRKNIEGYMQLNIGVVYNNMKRENIRSETIRRILPPTFKMYTGFSPIGLNIRLSEQVWFNTEVSLWSFETISAGLKFKFKDNLEHPRNWVGMD